MKKSINPDFKKKILKNSHFVKFDYKKKTFFFPLNIKVIIEGSIIISCFLIVFSIG
jgi:hypothetical protein